MSILERQPTGRLQGVVERFWYVETASSDADVICPDGRTEIVLHLGDPMRQGFHPSIHSSESMAPRGDSAAQALTGVDRTPMAPVARSLPLNSAAKANGFVQPRHILVGQMDRPMTVAATGRVAMVGATLEAGALHRLLPMSQDGIAGRVFDLEAVWGSWTGRTADQLAAAPTPRDALARLVAALEALLPDRSEPPDEAAIRAAVVMFRRTGGRASVARLARATGIGRRQFERRFREHVGLPPRLFARIVRFQRAFRALGHETGASIAARCGYSDQAHLIREIRRFSGQTPTLLAEADGLTAFFRG